MKGKPWEGYFCFSELLGGCKIPEMTVGFGDDDFISGTWHFKFAGKFRVGVTQDGRFLLIWKLYYKSRSMCDFKGSREEGTQFDSSSVSSCNPAWCLGLVFQLAWISEELLMEVYPGLVEYYANQVRLQARLGASPSPAWCTSKPCLVHLQALLGAPPSPAWCCWLWLFGKKNTFVGRHLFFVLVDGGRFFSQYFGRDNFWANPSTYDW